MIQDLFFPCITVLNCSNLLVCIWNPAWPVFGVGRIFMAGLVFQFGFAIGVLVRTNKCATHFLASIRNSTEIANMVCCSTGR
ncbi:hypothetical protein BJX65DRAFT_40157 [Aspergillus insuetus]